MKPTRHIIVSGIVGLITGYCFKSFGSAVISFIAGVALDADHFLDYYLNHPFTFKLKKIYFTCLAVDLKKIYLVLHSYELLFLLWLAVYILSLGIFWKALAIGVTQHLISDQITNPISTFGYFMTYRIVKGFKKSLVLKQAKGKGVL